jgi:DNA polymerase-1
LKADTLIVDGRHALWRTSDAFKMLSAEVGGEIIGTGGMYGFLCLMIRIHQKYGGRMIVAWEGLTNFRKDLYPEYKRKTELDEEQVALIEDMREQEKRLKSLLRFLGVKQYYGDGCEADDVIGRLANEYSMDENSLVIIYSGDSDLRQLVKENVFVAAPGYQGAKDTLYDQQRVVEKHGVAPGYISDLKALAGDSSDNVPGIRGIGPKWASKLINTYGDIESVICGAMGERKAQWPLSERFKLVISDAKDDIRLYKKLTTICTDMPYKIIIAKPNVDTLLKYFKLYHFMSLQTTNEMRELMELGK